MTMDLHSPQIQGFFKRPVDHLLALPVLCEYIRRLNLENLVVVSPDTGFAKSARRYASTLNVSVAIGDKIRRGHDERAEVLEIIGDVEGKNCLIVDDFSISGGTLVELAKGLEAERSRAYTSMPVAPVAEQGRCRTGGRQRHKKWSSGLIQSRTSG